MNTLRGVWAIRRQTCRHTEKKYMETHGRTDTRTDIRTYSGSELIGLCIGLIDFMDLFSNWPSFSQSVDRNLYALRGELEGCSGGGGGGGYRVAAYQRSRSRRRFVLMHSEARSSSTVKNRKKIRLRSVSKRIPDSVSSRSSDSNALTV